jgi:DNA mismatch endonuclease (patch repair protein)
MADVFSVAKRSLVMTAIKSKGSQAELTVRRALHTRGFRFLLHDKRYPGKPDILLPRFKTAIQVHGCFWHGHNCIDGHLPKSSRSYWIPKLKRNKIRDQNNAKKMRALGWSVVTIWECHCLNRGSLQKELQRIEAKLLARKPK